MSDFPSWFYYLYIIPVLGFMILIHELGHFAVAKWLGVRVEVFSIGFGKRLFGFRRGDTDYRVAAIPLGGYVKMTGENPMDERTDDPREFMTHSRWQRFIIAIAGPTMNILLAVGLLTVVYMVHYEYAGVPRQAGSDRGCAQGFPGSAGRHPARRPHCQDRRHRQPDLGAGTAQRMAQPQPASDRQHPARATRCFRKPSCPRQ